MVDPFSPEAADAFADKMETYYNVPTNWKFRDIGDWWSATLATGDPLVCTTTVYISPKWKTEQSPIWKYTLAHEWAHVLQGKNCVNNEKNADLIALSRLAEAREWKAFLAGANWLMETNQLTMDEVKGVMK